MWEYGTLMIITSTQQELDDRLNDAGKKNWELVSFFRDSERAPAVVYMAVFKRLKGIDGPTV